MPGAPKRSPSPTPAVAAENRIVDAAFRLYAEHGFDVPLSRIARAARVSPAVLTRCIGSKKSLLDREFKR